MGVIVMGLCCICLVACALAVLHLRSSSRRISGNRRRAEHSGGVSEDRSRDPLDVAAPPSYDTGSMISDFRARRGKFRALKARAARGNLEAQKCSFKHFPWHFFLRKSLLGQHQDKAVALSCLMLATGLMKTPSRSGKCM